METDFNNSENLIVQISRKLLHMFIFYISIRTIHDVLKKVYRI